MLHFRQEIQKISVKRVSMDPKKPIATLRLEKSIPKGSEGHLVFGFNGTMETATTEAFFKTTYIEQETER